MAGKIATAIISDINCHLSKSSKQYYSDFYIGITNDIERRLFGEHNVEEYFLEQGMKGDTGGGNNGTVYVYCYEITNNTIE